MHDRGAARPGPGEVHAVPAVLHGAHGLEQRRQEPDQQRGRQAEPPRHLEDGAQAGPELEPGLNR